MNNSNIFIDLVDLIVLEFKLGKRNIRYIYDTKNLNNISIISFIDIFPFFAILPLHHIWYYFNRSTP